MPPVSLLLQQKTQSAGLWGKSFTGAEQRACFARDFALSVMDLIVSRCKDKDLFVFLFKYNQIFNAILN